MSNPPHHHAKHSRQRTIYRELIGSAKWLREMADKNAKFKKAFDLLADRDVAAAAIIEILEKELRTIMGRTAAAIDKLEARIDEQATAIAARDRKIVSLGTQLATALSNQNDAADQADVVRVEGQTFEAIPPVADDAVTPPADTTTTTTP